MRLKILVIGGERNGEWINGLPDGIRMWIDIEHAARHVIRPITWNLQVGTEVTASYRLNLAVHEQLQGPNEPMVAQNLLAMVAMAEFAKAHGEPLEIPYEPAGSELTQGSGQ